MRKDMPAISSVDVLLRPGQTDLVIVKLKEGPPNFPAHPDRRPSLSTEAVSGYGVHWALEIFGFVSEILDTRTGRSMSVEQYKEERIRAARE